MTEAKIEANARSDPDNPPTTAAFWKNAILVGPDRKSLISLRVDADVIHWFRTKGKGYQTRMNAVLRAYMQAHRK